jgi:putative hydrolase of the HAD superfamily
MPRRFVVLFVDAVGTLLRVRGSVGAVYAPIAARHGLHAEAAALDAAFGAALAASPPAVFPGAPAAALAGLERAWWRGVVARTLSPLDRAPGFEPFFAEVFEHFRAAAPWEILPGARETLVALRAEGRRLGIVSDMDTRLHDVLTALDLAALFDVVVLGAEHAATKPDGSLFRTALESARVPATAAAHLGDSVRADIGGADAAGITPILFDPERRIAATADLAVAHGWHEVPELLRAAEG